MVYKNKAGSRGRKKRSVAGNGSGAEREQNLKNYYFLKIFIILCQGAYLIKTVKDFKNGSVGEGD